MHAQIVLFDAGEPGGVPFIRCDRRDAERPVPASQHG
jgi:hypothetical protein